MPDAWEYPTTYLLIEALRTYQGFFGDALTVPFPSGAAEQLPLGAVADAIADRLIALFLPGPDGRRPINGGRDLLDHDPLWRDMVTFPEYFHGDTGAGLGASHETGWTALVATLIEQRRPSAGPPAAG